MYKSFKSPDNFEIIICPDCDLLLKQINIEQGYTLFCPRCAYKLHTTKKNSVTRTLALSITAILLYLPAFFMPLMNFNYLGSEKSNSIIDVILLLHNKNYFFVYLIIILTSLLFPFAKTLLVFIISACLKIKYYPEYLSKLMRCHRVIDDWGMLDVYMISILVVLIKMHPLGYIRYNTGFFFFFILLFIALSSHTTMDEHLFWSLIDKKEQ